MLVKELRKLLKKCNPEAFIYVKKERESGTDFLRTIRVKNETKSRMSDKEFSDVYSSSKIYLSADSFSIYW